MQNYREVNGNVLAVVTLTVAAILGTIGLTVSDDSFDTASWSVVATAHAVAAPPHERVATEVRPAEGWSADESAQGMRPDTAH